MADDGLAGLPDALFAGAPVQSRRFWWRAVIDAGLPDGARPRLLMAGPMMFPLLELADGRLQSLTTPYTCLYQPLGDPAAARPAGVALARFARAWPHARLEALDADWPGLAALLDGITEGGLAAARFDHFGNWCEPVGGRSWQDYLDDRPGALRETVRRKLARAGRDRTLRFHCLRTPAEIDQGIAAYEDVYRRSWKQPEPHPRFAAALMRAAAAEGVLRLGVLRQDATPVAAQYWTVADGTATVLKLAHDQALKALSPGTVLTAMMLRELLDTEHVDELDFGRGDDDYKRLWATRRRQRIGLLLANPRRPAGMALLARHWLGRARRRLAGS